MEENKPLREKCKGFADCCLHHSSHVHAVYVKDGYHEDLFCCKCGEKICRNVEFNLYKKKGCLL